MPQKLYSPTGKDIILPAQTLNAGTEAAYVKKLQGMVDEMCHSVKYWLSAA